MLRSAERFRTEKGRYPGTNGVPTKLDREDLRQRLNALLLQHLKLPEHTAKRFSEKYIDEFCR